MNGLFRNSQQCKSQLTFTPEVLTCCTLDNHCDYYYLTLLVIYDVTNRLEARNKRETKWR